jgi:hypothetical protein
LDVIAQAVIVSLMQISAQQLAMDIVVMSGLRPLDTAAIRWRPSSSATVMAVSVMVNFSRSVLQMTTARIIIFAEIWIEMEQLSLRVSRVSI